MKEYKYKNVTIRIHDAEITPEQKEVQIDALKKATIKFMKKVMKERG